MPEHACGGEGIRSDALKTANDYPHWSSLAIWGRRSGWRVADHALAPIAAILCLFPEHDDFHNNGGVQIFMTNTTVVDCVPVMVGGARVSDHTQV